MSKVRIEFELNPYEEGAEIRRILNRDDAYAALWDVDQSLRAKLKYSEDEWMQNEGIQNYLESLREMIYESGVMRDYE